MKRDEFSRRTKLEAFTRCQGKCEGCGAILRPGHFEYDHGKAAAFGGGSDLANCVVLCRSCHVDKTAHHDVPRIAKTNRLRKREAGLKKKSTWRGHRKMNGDVVWND